MIVSAKKIKKKNITSSEQILKSNRKDSRKEDKIDVLRHMYIIIYMYNLLILLREAKINKRIDIKYLT